MIPVFNEIATIREILQRVSQVPLEKQIVVVDDGSIDGTREFPQSIAGPGKSGSHVAEPAADKRGELHVIFHDRNRGKGAALRTGGRTYEEGKKITWRDGVRALGQIVRYGVFS